MENKNETVSLFVYEGITAKLERTIKRLWIAIIIIVVLEFARDMALIYFISQYDIEAYDYAQDGSGVNIIGDKNGVEYHGTTLESQEGYEEEQ